MATDQWCIDVWVPIIIIPQTLGPCCFCCSSKFGLTHGALLPGRICKHNIRAKLHVALRQEARPDEIIRANYPPLCSCTTLLFTSGSLKGEGGLCLTIWQRKGLEANMTINLNDNVSVTYQGLHVHS